MSSWGGSLIFARCFVHCLLLHRLSVCLSVCLSVFLFRTVPYVSWEELETGVCRTNDAVLAESQAADCKSVEMMHPWIFIIIHHPARGVI